MKLTVVLYPGEDGWVVAECPVIPGCISQGKTRAEAIENIKEAIELCIETRREKGWPIFADSDEVEVAV
jgi:predicted RNase H-like HicB family nuclease